MGELDVYLRGSLMGRAHPGHNRKFSCFGGLEGEFEFDPRTDFEEMWGREVLEVCEGVDEEVIEIAGLALGSRSREVREEVDDEGFFEVECIHKRTKLPTPCKPKLSRSCTEPVMSHSPTHADEDALSWQTVECPDRHRMSLAYLNMLHGGPQEHRQRKLLKKRPTDTPASPSEVLQRQVFSHQVSIAPPHIPTSQVNTKGSCSSIGKLCRNLSLGKKKSLPVERWVCVEVVEGNKRTRAS
ncbi:hypothetical protein PQX77_016235 [Marasmius sp. AFHP31]|nr:hypothetical protein PQX77_016235 [Marasmius sp. AFHP31]